MEKDEIRQNELENLGYTIIRYSNQHVFKKPEEVVKNISEKVNNFIQNKTPEIGV